MGESYPIVDKSIICDICKLEFSSKTKLFRHLTIYHGYESEYHNSAKYQRVVLLFGWISSSINLNDNDIWERDALQCASGSVGLDFVEEQLFKAIYAAENKISLDEVPREVYNRHPKGYSRCSRSSQMSALDLGIEASNSGYGDIICMTVKMIEEDFVNEWINTVNNFLPKTIKIFQRLTLPIGTNDFNAEINATQRIYEYMIPMSYVMSENYFSDNKSDIDINTKRYMNFNNKETVMDKLFPRDTEDGQQRIKYFIDLKSILKKFMSENRKYFHNFCRGGTVPEDSVSKRRIDRLFHKELLTINNIHYVVFSMSCDDCLHGQLAKIIATVISIKRGWLPENCLDLILNKEITFQMPSLPSFAQYISECKYSLFESKYQDFRLDPRRNKLLPATDLIINELNDFKDLIQNQIALIWESKSEGCLNKLELYCKDVLSNLLILNSLYYRSTNDLLANYYNYFGVTLTIASKIDSNYNYLKNDEIGTQHYQFISNNSLQNCPQVYQKVLTLLREADLSGLWPHSSTARQKVLDNWTNGGSFSVGCLPKHLVQPKGNALFPDLMKACFELETFLCPDRTPSGTIAINRHAQFKPHRDSGAGNGQSSSLIVGLGDYSGGELLVEGVIHDIRYQPLTFDGWSQRHSTLPFVGERYTLVWFTPMGVERDDMFWLE